MGAKVGVFLSWKGKCIKAHEWDSSSGGEINAVFHKLLALKEDRGTCAEQNHSLHQPAFLGHNKNNMSCLWPPRNLQKSRNRQLALPHQMVQATLFMLFFFLFPFCDVFFSKTTTTKITPPLPPPPHSLGTYLLFNAFGCAMYGRSFVIDSNKVKD